MHQVEYNLSLTEAMLENIEPYLLSEEVYWPVASQPDAGSPPFPRLTLGGFLLTQDELSVQKATMISRQTSAYKDLQHRYGQITRKWKSAIGRKAIREMNSRSNLWHAYVEELEERRKVPYDYPREVRHRVMFERLIDVAGVDAELEKILEKNLKVDERFLTVSIPSDFLWDADLQTIYIKDRFWFLYRKLFGERN
jgi:hypothetical protein